MNKTDLDYLRLLPPFQELTEEKFDSLAENISELNLAKGETIFKVGDKGDLFYLIKSGMVRVYIESPESGEKIILSNLSEGDYFGEMALLTQGPRSASIETITNTSLLCLDKAGFDRILEEDPKISIAISHMLSQRLMQANLQRVASEQFYQSKISPSGSLEDYDIMEVLKFCEENSLTGKLILVKDDKSAHISFLKGVVQKVILDDLGDAEAMDVITQWKDGRFKIEPSLFTMDEEKQNITEEEPVNFEIPPPENKNTNIISVLEEFLHDSLLRLTDLIGSQQLNEEVLRALEKCNPYFPALKNCKFIITPKVEVNLNIEGEWTEKETLAIAVFLESIIKSCQDLVYGMSYLDFEEIAGEKAAQLRSISFFEYMDNAKEFTF